MRLTETALTKASDSATSEVMCIVLNKGHKHDFTGGPEPWQVKASLLLNYGISTRQRHTVMLENGETRELTLLPNLQPDGHDSLLFRAEICNGNKICVVAGKFHNGGVGFFALI